MKLETIAKALNCRIEGDPSLEISGVAGLDQAGPGELTFLSNPRYAALATQTRASALLAAAPVEGLEIALLLSTDPYLDFARALELFHPRQPAKPAIHPTAVIASSARIGPEAAVGPYVVVERNVRIGSRAVLHPHAVIEEGSQIGDDFTAHCGVTVCHDSHLGDRVTLHQRVTVGSDGFGFARRPDGSHKKIVQTGRVIIEDDVEIQAGSCVDRAAVGETRIGKGAIIDNLVQIGHAAKIGANTILCAQVGIAGSTSIGANCVLAGQVGVINHLKIGDSVVITAQSGVGHDVPDHAMVSGSPAFDNRRWLRSTAVYARLPELDREMRKLRKQVDRRDSDA